MHLVERGAVAALQARVAAETREGGLIAVSYTHLTLPTKA